MLSRSTRCSLSALLWSEDGVVGITPSVDSHIGHRSRDVTDWLADEPPTCSVPECRQTPVYLHPQRSKAQGDPVPSEAFLSWLGANMATGNLFLCCSLGRTQAPRLADWQTNRLCAQFFGTGRPLGVCTTRDLKFRVIQYLVTLLCPGRQQIWPQGISSSAAL